MPIAELRRRLLDGLPADRVADGSGSVGGVPVGLTARPRTTREVAQILACAHASGAAVVVHGARTKIDWGGVPRSVDLLLDVSGLSAIIEHEPGDLVAHVQAGVSLAALRSTLSGFNQRLALDEVVPGSTVGGVVATGLAGPRRLAFGAVRDLLIGITAVRSDGTITHSGGKVVKNVAGYDLGKLYTGSYGTLAVVTSAVFRLHPAPESAAYVIARPDDPGAALATLRHSQAALSAIEVELDDDRTTVTALVEGRDASVRVRAAAVARDVGGDVDVSADPPAGFGALPGVTTVKLTCALSGVAALLADVADLGRTYDLPMTVRGSAGVGVLYAGWDVATPPGLVEDLRAACGRRRGFAVVLRTTDGDRARLPLWGPVPGLGLMRRIKAEFDPTGLLAPGRFVGGILMPTDPDRPLDGLLGAFDSVRPPSRDLVSDCVHCGFCLPSCPTYTLWGEEMDSPRGRIHLIEQGLSGEPLSDSMVEHFDNCLGCMACVTACPSGVQYDALIETTRAQVERRHRRAVSDRLLRALIFGVFPHPRRLRAVAAPLGLYQRSGLQRRVRRSRIFARLPGALQSMDQLSPPSAERVRLPARVPAAGQRRAVVGMLTGCVQSVFFPGVNAATARVLAAEGCDVVIPPRQGCCGALSAHNGRDEEARRFARSTIDAFLAAGVDHVVVNSAGCGSTMKEYGRLLDDDPRYRERAAQFAAMTSDAAEFVDKIGPIAPRRPLSVSVAYHDACHLAHAQGIRDAPRRLLSAIPELELREIADPGLCCGSAGIYNLLKPEPAAELGRRKADNVAHTGASLLVTGNPGCLLQITAALRQIGVSIATAHTIEVLDASIRGVEIGIDPSDQPG